MQWTSRCTDVTMHFIRRCGLEQRFLCVYPENRIVFPFGEHLNRTLAYPVCLVCGGTCFFQCMLTELRHLGRMANDKRRLKRLHTRMSGNKYLFHLHSCVVEISCSCYRFAVWKWKLKTEISHRDIWKEKTPKMERKCKSTNCGSIDSGCWASFIRFTNNKIYTIFTYMIYSSVSWRHDQHVSTFGRFTVL